MPDQSLLKPLGATLRKQVAIVGVGNTDYAKDRQLAREGRATLDGYGLAAVALRRALDDAGLKKSEINGLGVNGPLAHERAAETLGLDVRWAGGGGIFDAAQAIASGFAETIALVYGNNQRTSGVRYGGPTAAYGAQYLAYVYFAPWGMTSQGAIYAMMARRFMETTGFTETDLGQVAISQRAFAALNPDAILRQPMTLDDYLSTPFVVEPLRLPDYCLVNDGGVAIILTTMGRARRLSNVPVTVVAMGKSDLNVDATTLRPRIQQFYHGAHHDVAEQVYEMAGLGPEDMDSLQIYDSFSVHIPFVLEGFGFCKPGEAGAMLRSGAIGPGGRLPTNTSGGMLSESYMQSWNLHVEAVRQLRGVCGERQTPNCRHIQYISDAAGKVSSWIYERGA